MANLNAKAELLDVININNLKIIAAELSFDAFDNSNGFVLYKHYNEKEYQEFLNFLDRDYNNGYGGQELFGTVWCDEGSWLERGEYDGSEWWNIHKYPDNIPIDLIHTRRAKIKNLI